MPRCAVRKIDPSVLNFIVADLPEEDYALAEASEELLQTRLEELKRFIHLQLHPHFLDGSADGTGFKFDNIRAVPLTPVRHERAGALLYLTEGPAWAVGVPKERTTRLAYFSRSPDAWKNANFKELIIALDTQIKQAARSQRDRDRDVRIDAIKALKNGDGCLDASAGTERERPLIYQRT